MYFDNNEQINDLVASLKDLLKAIKRDSDAISNLSINSIEHENDRLRKNTEDEEEIVDEVVNRLKEMENLKLQRDELWDINRQLNIEIDELK